MKSILVFLFISSITYAGGDKQNIVRRQFLRAKYNFMSSRGGELKQGEYKTFRVLFYKGNTYAILGFGKSGVKDIDVQVYDKNWRVIKEDYKPSGPMYAVQFKVKETGIYYIRTCMYEGSGYFFQSIGWK
jgi:hypothetical protein